MATWLHSDLYSRNISRLVLGISLAMRQEHCPSYLVNCPLVGYQLRKFGTFINANNASSSSESFSTPSPDDETEEVVFQGWKGVRSQSHTDPSAGNVPSWKYARMFFAVQRDGMESDVCYQCEQRHYTRAMEDSRRTNFASRL